MINFRRLQQLAGRPDRVSYLVVLLLFVLTVWLHLGTLLLAALFSYLALTLLRFGKGHGRWVSVTIFVLLVSIISFALVRFATHAFSAFPEIAERAIPSVIAWAQQNKIEVPFTDYEGFREVAVNVVKGQTKALGNFARVVREAGLHALYLIAGCVAAISIFLNSRFELGREPKVPANNLYSLTCEQVGARFRLFYQSFATVIGAQIVISGINTVLTGVFVLLVDLPYALLVVGVTFLCGLLPVVGNLISNTIIVGIGFTVSPKMALTALIFLVVIHKFEYFLNSKIIGKRIRNPLWLTLVALVVGERLMGIPGMILAPVVLNYVKRETSLIEVQIQDATKEPDSPSGK